MSSIQLIFEYWTHLSGIRMVFCPVSRIKIPKIFYHHTHFILLNNRGDPIFGLRLHLIFPYVVQHVGLVRSGTGSNNQITLHL